MKTKKIKKFNNENINLRCQLLNLKKISNYKKSLEKINNKIPITQELKKFEKLVYDITSLVPLYFHINESREYYYEYINKNKTVSNYNNAFDLKNYFESIANTSYAGDISNVPLFSSMEMLKDIALGVLKHPILSSNAIEEFILKIKTKYGKNFCSLIKELYDEYNCFEINKQNRNYNNRFVEKYQNILPVWIKVCIPEFINIIQKRISYLSLNFTRTNIVFEKEFSKNKNNRNENNLENNDILKKIRIAVFKDLKDILSSLVEVLFIKNEINALLTYTVILILRNNGNYNLTKNNEFADEVDKISLACNSLLKALSLKVICSEFNHWFMMTETSILNAINNIIKFDKLLFIIYSLLNHPLLNKNCRILFREFNWATTSPYFLYTYPSQELAVINVFSKLRRFINNRAKLFSTFERLKPEDLWYSLTTRPYQNNANNSLGNLNNVEVNKIIAGLHPTLSLVENFNFYSNIDKTGVKIINKHFIRNGNFPFLQETEIPNLKSYCRELTSIINYCNKYKKLKYVIPIIGAVSFKYNQLFLSLLFQHSIKHYKKLKPGNVSYVVKELLNDARGFFRYFEINNLVAEGEIDEKQSIAVINNGKYLDDLHRYIRSDFHLFITQTISNKDVLKASGVKKVTLKWLKSCFRLLNKIFLMYKVLVVNDVINNPTLSLPTIFKLHLIKLINKVRYKK